MRQSSDDADKLLNNNNPMLHRFFGMSRMCMSNTFGVWT